MKKKILLLLLVLTLVIPNVSMIQAASADYQESVNLIEAMGIITPQEAMTFKTDYITRDIFADKLFKLYNLPTGQWEFSGNSYSDVLEEDVYYSSIMYISANKIMRGYQDGTFKPDYFITGNEAVVSFINLLGYAYKAEVLGGYPSGYITAAKEIGLLKGLSLDYSYKLNGQELAKLIDNALTIPLVEYIATGDKNSYSISENSTILKSYFKMERETGVVTANEFISVSGSVSEDNCITVNGKNLKYTDLTCTELVGKEVTVIYNKLDESIHDIVYLGISSKDTSLTFDVRDYVSSSKDMFIFADENEEEEKVKTVLGAKIFYNNNELILKETLSDFISNIEDGKIHFVSTEGNKIYDVIFISEYRYMVVDRIDLESYVISDKISSKENISLDPDECKVVIKDARGNDKAFTDISEGNILTIIENANYKYVVISDTIVSGVLNSKSYDGAYVTYTIDDKEYKISADREKLYSSIAAGNSIEVYVNSNNEIVYMKKTPSEGYITAYIIKTGKKQVADEEVIIAKFFDTNGRFNSYSFKKGFKVNDKATEKNMTLDEFDKLLEKNNENKTQLSLIKINEDNEIISMYLARGKDELLAGSDDGLCLQHPSKILTFLTGVNCFSYKIHVNSLATPVMIIPKDIENASEKDFKVVDYTYLRNGLKTYVESYSYNKYSLSDDVVVLLTDEALESDLDDNINTVVIVSKTETINDEGDVITRFKVTDGSKENYFDVADDSKVKTTSVFNEVTNEYTPFDLDKGDIIRYVASSEGELLNFEFYYDADKKMFYEKNKKELIGNGLLLRDVAAIDSGWIAFLHGQYSLTPTDYIKFDITNKHVVGRVIVVTEKNSVISVKNGTTREIKPGDKTIFHICGNQIYTIVVLR